MDEKSMRFIDDTLREWFELANAAMRQENSEYAEMTKHLVALSGKIHSTDEISEAMKAEIADYLSLGAELDDMFRQYLYTKGAKDCVAVLRELGVIK